MKLAWSLALAVALAALGTRPVRADNVDERKPYGRVCLSAQDAARKESPLDPAAPLPTTGSLRVHADANEACEVLVVAFDAHDGNRLANGWRPVYAAVPEWEEILLPKDGLVWDLAGAKPFECYVLFLQGGTADAREIQRLVGLMNDPKTGGQVLDLQAGKLRELVTRQLAGGDRAGHLAAALRPDEVGGAFRGAGNDFPWRQFSARVNFAADRPGMLIFPAAGKTENAP